MYRFLYFSIILIIKLCHAIPDQITLGAIFSNVDKEVHSAFKHAIFLHNHNDSGARFKIVPEIELVDPYDTLTLTNKMCEQMKKGMFASMGTTESALFRTIKSFSELFQMPYISNGLPPMIEKSSFKYGINMRPDYTSAIIDTIKFYGWTKIIYLYDSDEGLLRLQKILQMASENSKLTNKFQTVAVEKLNGINLDVTMAQRIYNASHVIRLLERYEKRNRETRKYVLLDCNTAIAKKVIMDHAWNIKLGKRNYHYLFTDLALDEFWATEVKEFSAINITSFQVMDKDSKFHKKFIQQWKQLDSFIWPGAGTEYITAKAAFMFDGVRVVMDAFNRMLADKRDMFTKNIKRGEVYATSTDKMECRPIDKIVPWEHGPKIMEYLKKTRIEGLTGNITFDDEGKRSNFTVKIIELTPTGNLSTVARWSDKKGFEILKNRTGIGKQNKTYIVTTILEEPYIFYRTAEPGQQLHGNDRFDGYCADLAKLIAEQLSINYVLTLVNDSQYGTYKEEKNEWDGMIGELIREEADIAIAPLTITSERERVIDFTKPYMSQGISLMIKKPAKQKPGVFSFMNPLSRYIWAFIILAYLGVSFVLFIVSRFSPYEWHILNTPNGPKVSNEFSLYNSLWFALGAFMQQGCDICPRSISGRIIGSCWWLFTLIIVSSYTANLAAFLTVDKMVAPINSATELAKQTEVEYGIYKSGSTYDFFKRSKITAYARMYHYMEANRHVFADSYEDGIARVRNSKGKYAFLLESAKNDYINERQPCNTMKVGRNLDSKGYGVATPLKSHLREDLNLAVLHIKENGNLARLENKWWYERSECKSADAKDSQKNELTLSNVAGIFYILIGGLVFSMFIVALEFLHKSKTHSRSNRMPLTYSMKEEARLSIRGSSSEGFASKTRMLYTECR